MLDILKESFLDTYKMIPLLFLIYVIIELLESKYGNSLWNFVGKAGKLSIVIGALLGCIPQCGFSVIATALFLKEIISPGTLIAVYIATSDEAIPVMLVQPGSIKSVLAVIAIKIVIAIITGYLVDLVLGSFKKERKYQEVDVDSINEKGCCGHECNSHGIEFEKAVIHPFKHTLKIYAYIYIFTVAMGLLIAAVGESNIAAFVNNAGILSGIVIALVGIIPNCSASLIITQMYINGIIGFGHLITGLSAGAGLGIILLYKEKGKRKRAIAITITLIVAAILWGSIIEFII